MHYLAMNYGHVGRYAESMALHEKVFQERDFEHDSIWCILTYAQVCQRAGKFDQADRLLHGALEQVRKRDNSRRQGRANALGWLGLNRLLQHQYTEAEPLIRESVAISEKYGPDSQGARHFYWLSVLGAILFGQQRYAEAEPLLLQGYEGMKQRQAIMHALELPRLTEAGERIVRFYEVTQQPEKAQEWREKVAVRAEVPMSPDTKEANPELVPLPRKVP
jgi:tetratricopeptide (TPR) repeat protein